MIARQFAVFAGVGAVGTAAHFAVLVVLVERLGAAVLLGSTAGFITGAAINYVLNYHLTFASTRRHRQALPRFLLVAGIGMLLNAAIMDVTSRLLGLQYLLCQVAATALVLLWNFGANRSWTFGRKRPSPTHVEDAQ